MLLRDRAPAKVNLTLHVLGRRADGYHELTSLVAFAGCAADSLTLEPVEGLSLGAVDGPFADAAGAHGDNLVLKAARAAASRIDGLTLGRFALVKRVPVAAGLGGGSADAGAALRLVARANGLDVRDPRLMEVAAETGSDVPACLLSRACVMSGRGERIEPVDLPPTPAVLMNPLRPVATADVFRALGLKPGDSYPSSRGAWGGWPREAGSGGALGVELFQGRSPPDPADAGPPSPLQGEGFAAALPAGDVVEAILRGRNDLEAAAVRIAPEIGAGLALLASQPGCRTVRMSGSGATVFGLFDAPQAARRAARALGLAAPGWWVRSTMLR